MAHRWNLEYVVLLVVALTTGVSYSATVGNQPPVQNTFSTTNPCQLVNDSQVLCDGIQSLVDVSSNIPKNLLSQVTTLTIHHAQEGIWTLDDLVDLPSLHTLIFNRSYISPWRVPVEAGAPRIKVLMLEDSWNNGTYTTYREKNTLSLTTQVLAGLEGLEELHLIDCMTLFMDLSVLEVKKPLRLLNLVAGGLICQRENLWLLERVIASNETYTTTITNSTKSFVLRIDDMVTFSTSYSFNDRQFLICMNFWKETVENCPKECSCNMQGMLDFTKPIQHVNCQGKNLTKLPEVIPRHTTRIQLDHNNLTNIDSLFTSEFYRHMTIILLEHNQISSINGELFYQYLKNRPRDIIIALSYNNLKVLPVADISRIYEEGRIMDQPFQPMFKLANNPYECDNCSFLPAFQEFVYYQSGNIQDYQDIRCSSNSEHFKGKRLVTIDGISVCSPSPPLLGPIDIINITLTVLLLLLIINFLHNLYQYRRHGKLPWIIIRMPCC